MTGFLRLLVVLFALLVSACGTTFREQPGSIVRNEDAVLLGFNVPKQQIILLNNLSEAVAVECDGFRKRVSLSQGERYKFALVTSPRQARDVTCFVRITDAAGRPTGRTFYRTFYIQDDYWSLSRDLVWEIRR